MAYSLKPNCHPGRPDWAEYSFHHLSPAATFNTVTSAVKRIMLSNPVFPEMKIGNVPVDRVAVVINSNLGLKGTTGAERTNVLVGANLKQIIYCRSESGKWEPLNGISTLEYASDSTIFTVRLRIFDPSMRVFVNAPLAPVNKWEIDVRIIS